MDEPNKYDVIIGRNLKTAREEGGLTVEELAARMSVAPKYIEEAEQGLCRFGAIELIAIARALNVRALELMERIDPTADDR